MSLEVFSCLGEVPRKSEIYVKKKEKREMELLPAKIKECRSDRRAKKVLEEFKGVPFNSLDKISKARLRSAYYNLGRKKEFIQFAYNGIAPPKKEKKNKKANRQIRPNSTYGTYILSPIWRSIKNAYWQSHERKCAACFSKKKIHLHHGYYADRGQEKTEHLFPFCENCHKEFHLWLGKTKKDMLKETIQFITNKLKALIPVEN